MVTIVVGLLIAVSAAVMLAAGKITADPARKSLITMIASSVLALSGGLAVASFVFAAPPAKEAENERAKGAGAHVKAAQTDGPSASTKPLALFDELAAKVCSARGGIKDIRLLNGDAPASERRFFVICTRGPGEFVPYQQGEAR